MVSTGLGQQAGDERFTPERHLVRVAYYLASCFEKLIYGVTHEQTFNTTEPSFDQSFDVWRNPASLQFLNLPEHPSRRQIWSAAQKVTLLFASFCRDRELPPDAIA